MTTDKSGSDPLAKATEAGLEINRMLTISSAHVTRHDYEVLLDRANGTSGGYICDANQRGDILMVLVEAGVYDRTDQEMIADYGYSSALQAAVNLSRRHGCEWLRIHPDGPVLEDLSVVESEPEPSHG